uniref:Ethylene-responsive transcription factor ERF106-like n=1 Tax=Rhizophora mucronata TaxID=61149 RepID=A0A2P2QMS1_RHIMU
MTPSRDYAAAFTLLLFLPLFAGGPDSPASKGKFKIAFLPLSLNAAKS